MTDSRLTQLQLQVLELLAEIEPPWCLSGGAALAAVYTKHRTTRDLDLFWRNQKELGTLTATVVQTLEDAGLEVEKLHTGRAFQRLRIAGESESLVVDLIADPVASIEPPTTVRLGRVELRVDSAHEILVNKLCTLIERAELRDLDDVRVLLESGGDLERALADAPRKDGGFSPLTLAWLLGKLPIEAMARQEGRDVEDTQRLLRFRDQLIETVKESSRPE